MLFEDHVLLSKITWMTKKRPNTVRYRFYSIFNSILTQGDEGHDEDLSALSEKDRQKHAQPGWPEHITMYLLPTRLLIEIFLKVI